MKSIPTHRRNRGFTLIEVLIALVILSIGLLGIAGLQTRGQQFSYAAHMRTQATMLAYDIMDRIRMNDAIARDNVQGYHKASGSGADCLSTTCTPAQLRDFDVKTWQDTIAANLPGGTGTITKDDTGTTIVQYTITISWKLRDVEKDDPNSDDEQVRGISWVMQL